LPYVKPLPAKWILLISLDYLPNRLGQCQSQLSSVQSREVFPNPRSSALQTRTTVKLCQRDLQESGTEKVYREFSPPLSMLLSFYASLEFLIEIRVQRFNEASVNDVMGLVEPVLNCQLIGNSFKLLGAEIQI